MHKLISIIFSLVAVSLATPSLSAETDWRVMSETQTGEVRAAGWMQSFLTTQRDGLTGHIEVAGKPFDQVGWGEENSRDSKVWSYFEQTGYWADGALRLSYLIDDPALRAKVRSWIDYQISNPASDGYIGPDIENLWPHVVFFRAIMAEYSATKDPKIIEALSRHYKEAERCKVLYSGTEQGFSARNVFNVEILCWLYQLTGDGFFLRKAEDTYSEFTRKGGNLTLPTYASDNVPSGHSISSIEALKVPVILYLSTGRREYLDPAIKQLEKILAYHTLADGVPSGNEPHDGNSSKATHETCAVSDFQWTLGYFLEATGDVRWADQMERICFNGAMGVVSKDFKSHQYYGSTNVVVADDKASPAIFTGGTDRLSYRIGHVPACCTGNISRMVPVFCSRQWMRKGEDIVAALYAPSTLNVKVGGKDVSIDESTSYPFGETISFTVHTRKATEFGLHLRIPRWCTGASIEVNGTPSGLACPAGEFVCLRRQFKDGDRVTLNLPMEVRFVQRPYQGLSVERGPLLFCLPIKEKVTVKERRSIDGIEFTSSLLKPASKWNYAISADQKVSVKDSGDCSDPWNIASTPVKIRIKATEALNWQLYRYIYTPEMPSSITPGGTQELELVPFGATRLRISVFPDIDNIPSTDFKL